MSEQLYRLYPPPYQAVQLRGLYLDLNLQALGSSEEPFVYANFLSSLDGRIALEDDAGEAYLPKSLTTRNDFRLFLELQAQADCLIVHGGYLRALQAGKLGNILQIGAHEEGRDLIDWRLSKGLNPQPAIVIASGSLDFVLPDSILAHGQACLIATGESASPEKRAYWQDRGLEVITAGSVAMVEGAPLVKILGDKGYKSIYLVAGPHMLDTMVRDGKLSRLFQTVTHQLMGGVSFRSILPGPELGDLGRLHMRSLYYDSLNPAGSGQWFAQFDTVNGLA